MFEVSVTNELPCIHAFEFIHTYLYSVTYKKIVGKPRKFE